MLNKFNFLSIYTTENCSLSCTYCFLPKYPNDSNIETLKKILDWFKENSEPPRSWNVFGTEPLYRWDLLKFCIDYSYDWIDGMGITSNCVLLTQTRAEFLKEMNVDILCSMDGKKETHDKYRIFPDGSGSWDIVSKNVRRWAKLNPSKAEVATTLTPEFINDITGNVEAIIELGINNIALNKVQAPLPMYNSEQLNKIERGLDGVIELIIKYLRREDRKIWISFISSLMVKRLRGTAEINISHTCGAGKGGIATDIYGNIYICHQAIYDDKFKLGDVFNGIDWEKVNYWRNLEHIGCKMCKMVECSSCYTNNLRRFGDPFIIDPSYCMFNHVIWRKSFDLERRLREEKLLEKYLNRNI